MRLVLPARATVTAWYCASRFLFALFLPAPAVAQPLIHEAVVSAPIDQVWSAMTTAKGQESWMAAHADVDLRIGGLMRAHYSPDGVLGDAKTIVNEVLAFDPPRMYAIRVAKAPEGFPFPNAVKSMWTVVYLDAQADGTTRVRSVGHGFGADAESQQMRAFFDRGNAWTMKKLQERFAPAAAPK